MADAAPALDTGRSILDAARSRLLTDGYAGLSTRKVAEDARVPVSQLHYHFGSKQGLILALFEEENQRRLNRQRSMYAEELATLVASVFFGSEALLLLGFDREVLPIRSALRRVGVLIRQLEEGRTRDAGMPTVS